MRFRLKSSSKRREEVRVKKYASRFHRLNYAVVQSEKTKNPQNHSSIQPRQTIQSRVLPQTKAADRKSEDHPVLPHKAKRIANHGGDRTCFDQFLPQIGSPLHPFPFPFSRWSCSIQGKSDKRLCFQQSKDFSSLSSE